MNVNVHFASESTLAETTRKLPTGSGGRSRDPAKDAAIVQAARDCFFEKGFAAATMEEIAARAGVSKVTVYSRFPDKHALFEGFVRAQMASMASAFDAEDVRDGTLEQRLNAFGVSLLSFLFDRGHVDFKRAMMLLLRDMPDFARRFFDAGPGSCRALIASVLAEAAAKGEIAVTDPVEAAEDLVSLWKGFDDVEMEFGLIDGLDDSRIRAKVERGTVNFLRMVRV
jgi:TetR/AcrR family transcriptional regulator, mexJK operon transcriptional repressor